MSSPVAAGNALSVTGLRCRLSGRMVVDGVDLQVGEGEVVGLLGPNGAGKTTVMRVLIGAGRPVAGRVWLDGEEVTDWPVHRRCRRGLGYLAQEPSAFVGLTARQNVEAVLQLHGRSRRRADALLSTFGLARLAHQRAGTMSGGERRRLELARLMAAEPKVVLLDEPLAGLDPLAIEELCKQVQTLADRGVGVLMADHNVSQALTICRRACILVNGRVIASGSPADVIGDQDVRRTYLGTAGFISGSRAWH